MQYAEQFGLDPAGMGQVTSREWFRWMEWELAKRARGVLQKVKHNPELNWVTDLSASDRAAMRWANDEADE